MTKPRRKLASSNVPPKPDAKTVSECLSHPPTRRRIDDVLWSDTDLGPSRRKRICLVPVQQFSAQGMRLVYGRGDHFPIPNNEAWVRLFGWAEIGCRLVCHLDIWLGQGHRFFVRLSTNRQCHEACSYEIIGHTLPDGWKPAPRKLLNDKWVPEVLRDLYASHVQEWFDYPYD